MSAKLLDERVSRAFTGAGRTSGSGRHSNSDSLQADEDITPGESMRRMGASLPSSDHGGGSAGLSRLQYSESIRR